MRSHAISLWIRYGRTSGMTTGGLLGRCSGRDIPYIMESRQDEPMTGARLARPQVRRTIQADGSVWLQSVEALGQYEDDAAARMLHAARSVPEHLALADRKGEPGCWRTLSYAQLARQSAQLAEGLL